MTADPAPTEPASARHPWGIIGDDLSGTLAAAAELVDRGQCCQVFLGVEALRSTLKQLNPRDALAVTTESRHLCGPPARQIAYEAASTLQAAGVDRVLLKVDSLLRGPLPEQLEGVQAAVSATTTILCPAAPTNQRHLINGMPYDHGAPLELPAGLRPTRGGRLDQALTASLGGPIPHIDHNRVRLGAKTLTKELEHYLGSVRAVLLDASTQQDLNTIASAGIRSGAKLFAGTAELMGSLAEVTTPHTRVQSGPLPPPPTPILVGVGSASTVSRRQVFELAQRGAHVIEVQPNKAHWQRAATTAIESARSGTEVTVLVLPTMSTEAHEQPIVGMSQWLARAASAALETGRFSSLCATGGETARAIINRLGTRTLDVIGTYEVGLVRSTIVGGSANGLTLLTKPGAHGAEDTLARAILAGT